MKYVKWLALFLLLLTVLPVIAQEKQDDKKKEDENANKRKIAIGVIIGAYYPVSEDTREVFGTYWWRIGIRPISLKVTDRWTPDFDVNFYTAMSGEDNDAFLMPLTFGVTRAFGTNVNRRPYVAAHVGTFYRNVNVPSLGVDTAGWGLTGNVEAGILIDKKWYVELRYDYFDKFDDLDFSGVTLSVGLKLFDMKL